MTRTIAITGGTRGIGSAIAEVFLRAGENVAVCSRSPRDHKLPEGIFHVCADVRSRSEMGRFASAVVERYGSLDVFVNCAGRSGWRPIERVDEDFVHEILETSLMGTLWGLVAASSVMKQGGSIVNVSSLAGKRGSANNSVYCAAKFAVNGMTQALAKELGPRGIRVNAVCPVYVETQDVLTALVDPAAPPQGTPVRDYLAAFASRETALKRLPLAEEVARTVFFLAGHEASAVTGQCINVDCGTLPQ